MTRSTKTKGPFNKGPFAIYLNFRIYYFLSVWIANLGVVPLFLFSAFLFAPIFFFLFALLFSVTLVLETIYPLLKIAKKSTSTFLKAYFSLSLPEKSSPQFLLHKRVYVKEFAYLVLTLHVFLASYGLKSYALAQSPLPNIVILAKGEHKELKLNALKSFSVGNAEVLAHHYNESTQLFLIRGKALGRSEIMLWFNDGSSKKIEVEVVSKDQQKKQYQLKIRLNKLGLNLQSKNLSGNIDNLEDYLHFQSLLQDYNKQNWVLTGSLSTGLKKEILQKAYQAFFNHFIDEASCEERAMQIFCFYPSSYKIEKALEEYLKNDLGVKLSKTSAQHRRKNYRIKLKLIQFETSNGRDISFGLDRINVALNDVINNGARALVGENKINIGQQEVFMSTLAEPEALIHFGGEATIQVGGEIPYNSAKELLNNLSLTEWKFAGLKLKIRHSFEDGLHFIKYETEFTRPNGDGAISGSKESSSLIIHENHTQRIFQIGYQTQGNGESSLPYLSQIPVLGALFKSRNNQSSYKYITGMLTFSEVDDE
jgi:hypothetical protein